MAKEKYIPLKLDNPSTWWLGLGMLSAGFIMEKYPWKMNTEFDMDTFIKEAYAENHFKCYQMLEDFWFRLPDNESIRFGPFFLLCDLCSEYSECFPDEKDK